MVAVQIYGGSVVVRMVVVVVVVAGRSGEWKPVGGDRWLIWTRQMIPVTTLPIVVGSWYWWYC